MENVKRSSGAEAESSETAAVAVEEVDETMERAAAKIQAAFRGARVRQLKPLTHLRKIAGVRLKLSELQAKTADPAHIERICKDVMECRRLTEGIMGLLFQLDALQDVHPVVREIRKSVNREVVEFMEVIDAVVLGADSSPWQDSRNVPHIVRSSSISHIDRTPASSCPLKRMYSLDNHVCPDGSVSHRRVTVQAKEMTRGSDQGTFTMDRAEESTTGFNDMLTGDDGEISVSAAMFIQSRYRGYRVRRSHPLKHLRNIADVRKKLRELSIQISNPGFLAISLSDNRERLQFTERITALLLQLDSVQGVDGVVRDVRKSVTREVFRVQEVVDGLICRAQNEKRQCSSEVPGEDILLATQMSFKEHSPVAQEDDPSNQHFGGLQTSELFLTEGLLEQTLDLDLHNMPSPDIGAEKVQITTPYPDHITEYHVINPNTELKDFDDSQVRVWEIAQQSAQTSWSSSETTAEGQLNDQRSGTCAVFVSGSDYSCEQTETITTLNSDSSGREESSDEGEHFGETIQRKSGNKLGQGVYVDREDLQGAGPDVARGTVTSTTFPNLSHDTNYSDLEIISNNSQDQEMGSGRILERQDVFQGEVRVEQLDVPRDDCNLTDIESDLVRQKYNFILRSPNCVTSAHTENIPANGIQSHPKCKVEHLLSHEEVAENLKPSKHYLGNLPQLPKLIEDVCSGKDTNPTSVPEFDFFSLLSNHTLQPNNIKLSSSAENVKDCPQGGEACPVFMKHEDAACSCGIFSPSLASGICKSCGLVDTTWSLSTSNENSRENHVAGMGLIGPLVQENLRLRTLLNEVLRYSELQSCRICTLNERIEDEATRCKRQENIWRKKVKECKEEEINSILIEYNLISMLAVSMKGKLQASHCKRKNH